MIGELAHVLGDLASRRDESLHYQGDAGNPRFRLESMRGPAGRVFVFGGVGLLVAGLSWFIFESVVGAAVGLGWLVWELIREWHYPFGIFVKADPTNNQLEIIVKRMFGQQILQFRLDSFDQLELYADYSQGQNDTSLFRLFLRSKYERLPISLYLFVNEPEMHNLEADLRKRLRLEQGAA